MERSAGFFPILIIGNKTDKKRVALVSGRSGGPSCYPLSRQHPMDAHLTNRVVLVTGASGGIGSEAARAFVAEGARVVAHFSEHGNRAKHLAHKLGASCVPLGAD